MPRNPNENSDDASFDDMVNSLVDGESVEEAPVEEAPVEEAPVEEAPVEEAPVEAAKPQRTARKKAKDIEPTSTDVDLDALPESTRAEMEAGRAALAAKMSA